MELQMADIETMNQLVTGLRQKKINLEANEKVFLKVSGINEEIEKANQDKAGYDEEITDAKQLRDEAKKKKADAVSETTSKIAKKMNKVLPFGNAVFSYVEDDEGKRSMKIGWKVDDKTTPYNGLSGGEKQIFDAALANVLDANIIVVEAAELDDENLLKTLKELAKLDKQVIVNTCHLIKGEIPEPFTVIEV
jgi:hypothetical protein